MHYCSLHHRTLLLSPVTSTTGYYFCFGSILHFSGVISPLISSSILGTYWPGEFFFQYPIHSVLLDSETPGAIDGNLDKPCTGMEAWREIRSFWPSGNQAGQWAIKRPFSPQIGSEGSPSMVTLEMCALGRVSQFSHAFQVFPGHENHGT